MSYIAVLEDSVKIQNFSLKTTKHVENTTEIGSLYVV